jgi:hypothetical protein
MVCSDHLLVFKLRNQTVSLIVFFEQAAKEVGLPSPLEVCRTAGRAGGGQGHAEIIRFSYSRFLHPACLVGDRGRYRGGSRIHGLCGAAFRDQN